MGRSLGDEKRIGKETRIGRETKRTVGESSRVDCDAGTVARMLERYVFTISRRWTRVGHEDGKLVLAGATGTCCMVHVVQSQTRCKHTWGLVAAGPNVPALTRGARQATAASGACQSCTAYGSSRLQPHRRPPDSRMRRVRRRRAGPSPAWSKADRKRAATPRLPTPRCCLPPEGAG